MKRFLLAISTVTVIFILLFSFVGIVASKLALLEVFINLAPTTVSLPKSNVLIVGIDNAFGHRSDTIMVLHTDPENKEVALFSIPRDTLALLPDRGLDKINHAYAYGGIDLTRKAVENLLKIDIPYYVSVNLSGITNIIDELGGITIDVEKRMYYVDHAGGLYIDLQPGMQKLSGEKAMGYLRYRRDGGDFKRIARQQKFLRCLGNEILKKEHILSTPKLLLALIGLVETNLNSKQTVNLALGIRAANELGNINMVALPGRDMMIDGIYYWRIDEEKVKNMVKNLIYGEKSIAQEDLWQ